MESFVTIESNCEENPLELLKKIREQIRYIYYLGKA